MDDTPVYNLKAVVRETGLKPDTLRAWERRYGLPTPDRSGGGHRLYSERDIQILKWLVARQQAGLSISRAADLWHRLSEQGQDPAQLPEYLASGIAPRAPVLMAGQALEGLRSAWLEACLAFDEPRAEAAVGQALAQYPAESICLGLFLPALAEIGERWYRGEVTPHQEHFASELAQRRVESLLAATPNPVLAGRILVTCPPDEQHTFVPLVLTLLLRRRGWAVTYLGANAPHAQFEQTLDSVRPQLCVMAAQTLHAASQMLPMTHPLQAKGIPLAFGGTAFLTRPALASRIPGHYLGDRLEDSLDTLEALLSSPPPTPVPVALAKDQIALLPLFLGRRARIDAQLLAEIPPNAIPAEQLRSGIDNLGQAIADGLSLGDLDLVATELAWVEGLIVHAKVPVERLIAFLRAYARALEDQLGSEGRPVVAWLDQLIRNSSNRSAGG